MLRSSWGQYALVVLIVTGYLLSSGTALAVNTPSCTLPKRSHRLLAVGNAAWYEDYKPAVTAGGIYQLSIFQSTVRCDAECGGRGCVDPPQLYAHTLLSGGVNDSYDGFLATAQLGFMVRPYWESPSWISAVGVAAQGIYSNTSLGPVARIEILDNLGFQLGWLKHLEADALGGVWFVSLDYMATIVSDLHLRD